MTAAPPRVLYLASGRGFRSGPTLLRKIEGVIGSFRVVGAQVRVICGEDIQDRKTQAVPLSQKVKPATRLPLGSFLYHSVSEFRDIRHDRRLKEMVEQVIGEFRPTLIWERSSRLHTAGIRAAKAHGVPFVLEWVDNLLDLYGASLFKARGRKNEKLKMALSDFIVVPSARLVRLLTKEWGLPPQRFVVAINGVDPDEFCPARFERGEARKRLGIPDDAFVVGFVGTYQKYHGVPYLIEAARELGETGRLAGKLFLMVGDGPGRAACEDLAEIYGISGSFQFLGNRPKGDIPLMLGACDAAVTPDCGDILCPIKVQEYLAMGLPVLVPDYDANREVVDDGKNGLCFRPRNPQDLAEKIHLLAADPELVKRMGLKARESVLERFTWEKTWGMALRTVVGRT